MTHFSTPQTAYLAARAAYEASEQRIHSLMESSLSLPETDEGIDLYCQREEAIRTELGAYRAWDALRAAEDALLVWRQEQAKTVKEYRAYAGMLDEMFLKVGRHPAMKQKVITLLLKLDVSGKAA